MKFLREFKVNFLNFVNQENAKLTLLLNLIEPRCGGVLIVGKKGTGKSTLIKAFSEIVKNVGIPIYELPMNATEEAVLGGIDIENTIKYGKRVFQKGFLSKVNGGFLIIEDINLFPLDILSVVFETQARGVNIIEREGFKLSEPSNFQILATMNPEEAEFSSHFLDRFGLCVFMDEKIDKEKKKEIVKFHCVEGRENSINGLIEKIKTWIEISKKVHVPDDVKEFIAEVVLNEAVSGHRADIYLYYASKAFTAYKGETIVTEEHVKVVAPFVLNHRRRFIEPPSEEQEHSHESSNTNSDENKEKKEQKTSPIKNEDFENAKSQEIPSSEKEEIFPVGEPFKVKRLILRKDRLIRTVTGRRTKTKAKGRGGRYIRSLIQKR
ncbi:AAA family ATPase [Thermodesulfovibrio hydrogeniphilus]